MEMHIPPLVAHTKEIRKAIRNLRLAFPELKITPTDDGGLIIGGSVSAFSELFDESGFWDAEDE
jgi:hypothetical protein